MPLKTTIILNAMVVSVFLVGKYCLKKGTPCSFGQSSLFNKLFVFPLGMYTCTKGVNKYKTRDRSGTRITRFVNDWRATQKNSSPLKTTWHSYRFLSKSRKIILKRSTMYSGRLYVLTYFKIFHYKNMVWKVSTPYKELIICCKYSTLNLIGWLISRP